MCDKDAVRLSYVVHFGRKKCRLIFSDRRQKVLWYAQLFDLIQTVTNIALVYTDEDHMEDVATPAVENNPETSDESDAKSPAPSTPPIPSPDNPLVDSLHAALGLV
jgi:hypothetical protein